MANVKLELIIDGGANVGEYAVGMRKHYPHAEIHSFEPTPELFKNLQARFAADKKIQCYGQALSDTEGTAQFRVTPNTVSSSLLEDADSAPNGSGSVVSVPLTTLDTWAGGRTIPRPSLLKLDIEGNELAALRGAKKLLKQIDYIELEITFPLLRCGQPTLREILNFLDDYGFDLIDVYPGILDPKTGRSNWADVLFARHALNN